MRVLAIGNLYPPAGGGGYERIFASTVAAMRARGHDVSVLTTAPVPGMELPADMPEQPGVYRELRWWWRDHGFPKRSLADARAIELHNATVLARHIGPADVVSWWGMGGMSLSLLEHVRKSGVPSVGVVGDGWMRYGPQYDAWQRKRRWLGRRPDLSAGVRWLFISRFLLEKSPRVQRAEVVPPGVDPARFPERPAREWGWRLAVIGRIEERKGTRHAIAALDELPAEATLTLDGPADPAHLAELRALAGGRVTFAHSPSERIPDVYAAADAVIFPVTWREPWGLVPLEAMATGRPVVATATGGAAEYLARERNALIVEPGDPGAIAAAVRRLAGDPALRERLRAGGRETAARYDQAAFEQRVIDALEDEAGPPVTGR